VVAESYCVLACVLCLFFWFVLCVFNGGRAHCLESNRFVV